MDTIEAIRFYINRLVSEVRGVKMEIMSLVYSQSEIMKNEIFLVDKISNKAKREKLSQYKCLIFVRPTRDNISLIKEEIESPSYKEYNLYFSNILPSDALDRIASSDKNELVKEVFEYYADYLAVDRHCFSLAEDKVHELFNANWSHSSFERIADGIASSLLSMKRRPFIRFQKSSQVCKKLAQEVSIRTDNERKLFAFGQSSLVLILDRRDDPITPLLTQWTYQAMIHEIVGIKNNTVEIRDKEMEGPDSPSDDTKKKPKSFVLTPIYDDFYRENMYSNWGDLCTNIAKLVETYKKNKDAKENLKSIEDIHKFMADMPKVQKITGEFNKHVSLVHEIKNNIKERRLMDVSQLEQEMISSNNHREHVDTLKRMLGAIKLQDAIRLTIIYALRYENNKANELKNIKSLIRSEYECNAGELDIIEDILLFAGSSQRSEGLFGEQEEKPVSNFFKNMFKNDRNKDEVNILTQHKPLLLSTLQKLFQLGQFTPEQISKRDAQFPFEGAAVRDIPKEIIVFMVGGYTYEEANAVYNFNNDPSNKGRRTVILGGNAILNSQEFYSLVKTFHDKRRKAADEDDNST